MKEITSEMIRSMLQASEGGKNGRTQDDNEVYAAIQTNNFIFIGGTEAEKAAIVRHLSQPYDHRSLRRLETVFLGKQLIGRTAKELMSEVEE